MRALPAVMVAGLWTALTWFGEARLTHFEHAGWARAWVAPLTVGVRF